MIREFFASIRHTNNSMSIRFNILLSFVAKGIGVASSFITVPMLLWYLDDVRYGIWLTLTSVLQWITMFDFGLGNGFRNKFVVAKANSDHHLASEYVSTSYFVLSLISFLLIICFVVIFFLFDLSIIFNAPARLSKEINFSLLILGCLQAIKFTVDLINYLLISDQRVGFSNLLYALSSLLIPVGYFLFAQVYKVDLISLSLLYLLIPNLILVLTSFYLFNKMYATYKPSIKRINISRASSILNLGLRFFMLQISALIVFTTDNIIISNLFGPAAVVPYNIAFKYFSIINFVYIIVITPLWAAFTKEYELGNFTWIKSTLKKALSIWVLLSITAIMMLFASEPFYHLWVGDKVEIPFDLSLGMMVFAIISNWNSLFAFFLNGISKVQLQLITGIFIGILNVPLSIFMARNCNLGPQGVIMATSICLLVSSVLQPIQTIRIIHGRAKGIWNN